MTSFDDLEIRGGEPEPEGPLPPKPRSPLGPLLAGLVVLLAVSAGLAFWLLRKPPTVAPTPPPTAEPAASPAPAATPVDLPELDGSDTLVRQLARGMSDDPGFAAWLATPNLVRTLSAAIVNVAEGVSPAPHLGFLTPTGTFAVVRRGAGLAIDPRSYARYDTAAGVVTSLDATACARVFGQLEPLFERAYRELGYPRGRFRDVLVRGAAHLLETPALEGDVLVRPVMRPSLVYELADPLLEALSPPQKHLLRMGPANVRKVQVWLRALSDALRVEAGASPDPSAPPGSR